MMIASSTAADPFAAAAALDRSLRSPDAGAGASTDSPSDSTTLDSGPDVVVTLNTPASPPLTYDASGKFGAPPPSNDSASNDGTVSADAAPSATAANDPSVDAPAENAQAAA